MVETINKKILIDIIIFLMFIYFNEFNSLKHTDKNNTITKVVENDKKNIIIKIIMLS